MLKCCAYAFSLHRESPDMIMGDKPLISKVVLSQASFRAEHDGMQPRAHTLLAEKFSNTGLQPLESWCRSSSTKTRLIIMITMEAERPLSNKLGPPRNRTFCTKAERSGGLSPRERVV
jgi:hypothetical protein